MSEPVSDEKIDELIDALNAVVVKPQTDFGTLRDMRAAVRDWLTEEVRALQAKLADAEERDRALSLTAFELKQRVHELEADKAWLVDVPVRDRMEADGWVFSEDVPTASEPTADALFPELTPDEIAIVGRVEPETVEPLPWRAATTDADLRERLARELYETFGTSMRRGQIARWNNMTDEAKEPWLYRADRVLALVGTDTPDAAHRGRALVEAMGDVSAHRPACSFGWHCAPGCTVYPARSDQQATPKRQKKHPDCWASMCGEADCGKPGPCYTMTDAAMQAKGTP